MDDPQDSAGPEVWSHRDIIDAIVKKIEENREKVERILESLLKQDKMLASAAKSISEIITKSDEKKQLSSQHARRLAAITAMSTILGIFLTTMTAVYLNSRDARLQRLYDDAKDIKADIIQKEKSRTRSNEAMNAARREIETRRKHCVNGKYQGPLDKLYEDLTISAYELSATGFESQSIFTRDAWQKLLIFLSIVDSRKDICSADYPSDATLKDKQVEVSAAFLKEINDDKTRRTKVLDRVSSWWI